jgi:putative colanic acid biosynthesis acetyltransferase WcaF
MSSQETKTNLASFNNNWYNPGPSWKRALWYPVNAIFFYSWFPFSAPKRALLKLFGATLGKGVVIKPRVNIKYPWNLNIGNHVWIGEGVWIDNLGLVAIRDHVCISQGAMLLCGNHNYKKSSFDLMVGDITLEEGTWIGAHAVVCPGVTCKSHSVLSVNSVATSNLEAYSIYQGNPATKQKDRVISA